MTILITNRKAHFSYEIIEKIMVGLVLFGSEVKSLKNGSGSLDESFIIDQDNNLAIVHFYIAPYQIANQDKNIDPERPKRLLANRREINDFLKQKKIQGLTIIPLSLHNIKGRLKLEIALARGKKAPDKRNTIKTRDVERELGRTLKNRK